MTNSARTLLSLSFVVALLMSLQPGQAWADCPNNGWGDQIVNTHEVTRPIFGRWYNLQANQTYSWEFKNVEPSYAWSVMRVFGNPVIQDGALVSVQDLARDFSSQGNGSSKITSFTAPYTGLYLVIVHADHTEFGGVGDLWFNGALSQANVSFGGVHAYSCRLNVGEKIHTMHEPGGADYHQMIVAGHIRGPALYFGMTATAYRTLTYEHTSAPIAGYVHTYTASQLPFSGVMSQVWNDAATDTDGDGVGNLLEYRMGTCPNGGFFTTTKDGYQCWRSLTSKDTDDDGLTDYEELFGVCEGTECIPFRLWGADPAQKDVFVEVDWDPSSFDGDAQGISTSIAHQFTDTAVGRIYDLFSAGFAGPSELNNPNGKAGLRVHFDVANAEAVNFTGPGENNPMLVFDGGGSNPIISGQICGSHSTRRNEHQSNLRKRYFRYLCAHADGGGNASLAGFSMSADAVVKETIAHELGHSLGLGHGGSDGINGKPHYFSIMNYSYTYDASAAFSQVFGSVVLNPTNLCETDGLGPGVPTAFLTGQPYQFEVSPEGYIDWNRDGEFSDCSTPVRAPITWGLNRGTGSHAVGKDVLNSLGAVNDASLVRISAGATPRLYMFYSTGTNIRYRHTAFDGECPQANPGLGDEVCGNWSGVLNTGRTGPTLAAAKHVVSGIPWIYIAHRTDNSNLRVFRARPLSSGNLFISSVAELDNLGPMLGTPSLVVHNGTLRIYWRRQDNRIAHVEVHSSGFVSPMTHLTDPNGQFLHTYTSPSVALRRDVNKLYLVHTTSTNQMLMAERVGVMGNVWAPSADFPIPTGTNYRTTDKPGFVWVAYDRVHDPLGPGHWMIVYPTTILHPDAPSRDRHMKLLHISRRAPRGGELHVKFGQFHHVWFRAKPGSGMFLLDEPGDPNIIGVLARPATSRRPERINVLPYADGIFDLDMTSSNDFALMANDICTPFGNSYPDSPCHVPGAIVLPPEELHDDCDI